MTQHQFGYKESLFSAASAGFFFILVGAIFTYTAFVEDINLFDRVLEFFRDFEIAKVPNADFLQLPKPEFLNRHSALYMAATRFSLVWGIYQISILIIRMFAGSPILKKAEAASNAVFWLGTTYLISTVLIGGTRLDSSVWFGFWGQII
ncbi:MAG: hypothetical protein GWO20_06010, partial [Candidatus Korarchaeota archaeon]|nr:hypothetical protein [Candidatus Korarchaeota archaeon]